MWVDYFSLAFGTFTHQKKRTFLTLIGIFIGIAAVVSLISLGQGMKYEIDKQFQALGSNKVIIQPGGGGFDLTGNKLTDKDLEAVKSVQGVDEARAAVFKIAKVKIGKQTKYTWVIGLDTSASKYTISQEYGMNVVEGREIQGSGDAMVGYDVWNAVLFDKAASVGDSVTIEGKKFNVVGNVERRGNPQDDSQIEITFDDAIKIFNLDKDKLDYVFVTTKEGAKPSDVAEKIKKALRKTRNVKEGDEDFVVQTSEDLIKAFSTVLTIIQIVLISIAGISLLVGGVNITNTMYTSVLERTNEIGIMKAIGARNSDVFLIFLIESGILGVVGGVIGIALGIGLSKLVALGAAAGGYSIITAIFPWYLTGGALAFSFVVGAVAGTLPAIQASKLKPVDALRYE
jgi:putative ABC transport system permease protein